MKSGSRAVWEFEAVAWEKARQSLRLIDEQWDQALESAAARGGRDLPAPRAATVPDGLGLVVSTISIANRGAYGKGGLSAESRTQPASTAPGAIRPGAGVCVSLGGCLGLEECPKIRLSGP